MVKVRVMVGETIMVNTNRTLTHNPNPPNPSIEKRLLPGIIVEKNYEPKTKDKPGIGLCL